MSMVFSKSLGCTLDAVNEAFFYGRSLPKSQREQAAKWIAGRQGKPGSYANMFAPTSDDMKKGVRLFTGERILSRAGIGHILGEEACRALVLLNASVGGVRAALERARSGMMKRLNESDAAGQTSGMYCCGKCSPSLWRNLAAGGLSDAERRLEAGMKALKAHREGNGKWRRFPFYYTLLALSEIDLASARGEMRYAGRACERCLRGSRDDEVAKRRRVLAERILEMC